MPHEIQVWKGDIASGTYASEYAAKVADFKQQLDHMIYEIDHDIQGDYSHYNPNTRNVMSDLFRALVKKPNLIQNVQQVLTAMQEQPNWLAHRHK